MKKIIIGSDHAGYQLKSFLKGHLENQGYRVEDKGPTSPDSVDYPDFAHPVASAVEESEDTLGILICGSANGVAMTANKHQDIRAAIAWTEELASLARQHNNANILCLPARFILQETALSIMNAFLTASFEGGRHQNRVSKISC